MSHEALQPSPMKELLSKNHQKLSLLGLFFLSGLAVSCSPTVTPTVATETRMPVSPTVQESHTQAPTLTPEPTATITPTSTPRAQDTLYYKVRNRIREISQECRNQQKKENPAKWTRQIDPTLENIDPTVLILGCGKDNVAYGNHKQKVCANSEIILADKIKRFSLTHDTGFPKEPGKLVRSDELWLNSDGSFSPLRDGWQEATRAPIDFIIVIDDYTALGRLVDISFGKRLKINVSVAFTASPIWEKDGQLTDEYFFNEGENILDQTRVLQYMSSTPNKAYTPELENHVRIQHVLEGMWAEVDRKRQEGNLQSLILLTFNTAGFLNDQLKSGNVLTDSNLMWLTGTALETTGKEIASAAAARRPIELSPGKLFAEPLYLLDPAISPNKVKGLRWGTENDPFLKRHQVPDNYFEIPDWNDLCQGQPDRENCGANFYTNNPERDYWPPVSLAFKNYVLGK